MAVIKRGYAGSKFGQVHYRIASSSEGAAGIPLLCLHQTPANGHEWLPVMEPLARGRTVVAMDTPGYGMSDPPPAPGTIEDFAEVADRLMRDLAWAGLVPAGVYDAMGIHTGSVIATQLARSLPQRVRRIVLFGLAAYPQDVREAKLANLATAFPPPGKDLGHVERLWAIFGELSDPRIPYEERHLNMAECLRLGSRMTWGFASVYRYDFLAAMAEVGQPVLVMNPEDDLCEVTRATSHLFRNGRRMDLAGVKHGVLKLERDLVATAIEEFLKAAQ